MVDAHENITLMPLFSDIVRDGGNTNIEIPNFVQDYKCNENETIIDKSEIPSAEKNDDGEDEVFIEAENGSYPFH